jgi:signal transduction histidine kinase
MSDGLFVADKNYNYLLLNNSAREFVYKADLVKKVGDTSSYTKYYDSAGSLLAIENFFALRILKGKKLKEYRLTCHRPDGIFHFSLSGSPVYDKSGNVVKAVICSRDITERVNKDELIRQQNEQLEAIIENISEEFIVFNKNGEYLKVNKAARENPVYDVAELKSSENTFRHAKFYDIDGNLISFENFPSQRVIRGERFSEYILVIKNSKGEIYKGICGTPIYDSEGNFIAGVLLCHDIADRLKEEENIIMQTHYDLLNRIIENLDLGFARCSYPDFKILNINNKFYEILIQINPELESPLSVKGEDAFNIAYGKGRGYKTEVVENFEKGRSAFFKIRKTIIAGEEKFYKVLYQPLRGFNNQIIEVIIVLTDITEEVKARNKMEEALKVQEEIFANVSHELKTPLNVIFSSNQLMELYLKKDVSGSNKGKVLKNINIIKQNCYRFTKLINNIIDLSKIDSGFLKLNLSNENIVDVIENIVSSVSEYVKAKDLNIVFDTDVEEKVIAVDASKIERVMLNLISNAIKFSDPGSTIYVNVEDKGDFVQISVKDSGVGIDEEHLNSIFERFHQVDGSLARNSEGSGIGLFLVKSIIDLHGGKISVESEVNKGSTFKIELPAKAIEKPKVTMQIKPFDNKIEMIQIEFSDIYSI